MLKAILISDLWEFTELTLHVLLMKCEKLIKTSHNCLTTL